MKKFISFGILIFGSLGGWIGSLIDHNSLGLGAWGIGLSALGSFFGIWVGYKVSKYYL